MYCSWNASCFKVYLWETGAAIADSQKCWDGKKICTSTRAQRLSYYARTRMGGVGGSTLSFVTYWVWQGKPRCLHGTSKRGICPGKVKRLLLLLLPCHSKVKKTQKTLSSSLQNRNCKGGKHLSSDYENNRRFVKE